MSIPPAKTRMGEVLRHHGSDKAWPHCFDAIYTGFFPDPGAVTNVLEIGIAGGASLRAWREYFPNTHVVGVDNQPSAMQHAGERIECHCIDQCDYIGLWQRAVAGRKFDWIIEDAAHVFDWQVLTFIHLWQALKPGGFYCIEDAQGTDYYGFQSPTCMAGLNGKYYDLNTPDFTDGGQLFVFRRPE